MNMPWLEPVRTRLHQQYLDGRLGHAPLLLGTPGIGKRALAEWLARRILCTGSDGIDACGRCRACALASSATHPDWQQLAVDEGHAEILVDQIRDFQNSLYLTPAIADRRVGSIIPVDRLNRNAANALLKTLEEPPPQVWIVMVCDQPDRVPATLLSRCQQIAVPVPDRDLALQWLAERVPDSGAARLGQALSLADGAPLTALEWLSTGEIETALQIGAALGALLERDGSRIEVIAAAFESLSPAQVWAWLARWTSLWMKAASGLPNVLPDGLRRPSGPQATRLLARAWQDALDAQRLADRKIRHDWLLRAWLAHWERLASC
ncbi:MAG: hypothetical protein Kow0020_12640 [Wenzhouxiangellaceae bacterium]